MNFVLEPQPNDEGDGEANNHTSEALNKTLDHAKAVRLAGDGPPRKGAATRIVLVTCDLVHVNDLVRG